MQKLNRKTVSTASYTPRILQFGGGNFLRGFVDYIVDTYNKEAEKDLGITVVKITSGGDYKDWRAQDGLFFVLTKGIKNGAAVAEQHLVSSISDIIHCYNEWEKYLKTAQDPNYRFIISNTTESGLNISDSDERAAMPPHSFPAKLTLWLYERYQYFDGKKEFGCIIIPCELVVDNGILLKNLIIETARKWTLSSDFIHWIEKDNIFCNTLVDRIVPGVSAQQMQKSWEDVGYEDALITEGEPYHIWVIEGPEIVARELPFNQIPSLNVVYTDDITPYRVRKVRILNGAHTSLVPVAYLMGLRTVLESIHNEVASNFLNTLVRKEIIPFLNMPGDEVNAYADNVMERFGNPNIRHFLLSISLNSFSKFKHRIIPSLKAYFDSSNVLPPLICLSFSCLILFYKGTYKNETIPLKDEEQVITKLHKLWNQYENNIPALVHEVLAWKSFWEEDLTAINDLENQLSQNISEILIWGIEATLFKSLKF